MMLVGALILISGCASNNAIKLTSLKRDQSSTSLHLEIPSSRLYAIFEVNNKNIELLETKTHLSQESLNALLKGNEGKDLLSGDYLKDCLLITNKNTFKSCFNDENEKVSSNSVYHISNGQPAMFIGAALFPAIIPLVWVSDVDFFFEDQVNPAAVKLISEKLKAKIIERKFQLMTAMRNDDYEDLPTNISAYSAFIDHDMLITKINKLDNLLQFNDFKQYFKKLNYKGYLVKSAEVNQRKKPSKNSRRLKKHKKGELIYAEKVVGDWLYTGDGYIFKGILTEKKHDAEKSLSLRQNKLKFAQSYDVLLAGRSIKPIDEVLDNKRALVGISSDKIKQLKLRKKRIIDDGNYQKALKENTLNAYSEYLINNPNGHYKQKVISAKVGLYEAQSTFDGFMNAYKLSKTADLLDKAYNAVINAKQKVELDRDLLTFYIENTITSPNDFERLNTLFAHTEFSSFNSFEDQLVSLPSFGENLKIDTFFNSPEYKYILKNNYKITTALRKNNNKFYIDVSFNFVDVSFVFNSDCHFVKEKAVSSETGFLDSIFTFGADQMTNYYNVYSCSAKPSDMAKIEAFSERINNEYAYNSIARQPNWQYSSRSSRDTDYYYDAPSSNYNNSAVSHSSSNNNNTSSNHNSSKNNSKKIVKQPKVKEVYDGGRKSSDGFIIYIVRCNSGRSTSTFRDNKGWWKDSGGSNFGEKYRYLSNHEFAVKYCQ